MNYIDALKFIHSADVYGRVPGLKNINILMDRLCNIHNDIKCIHIAGTNGKGSVCSFISSILTSSGFKVGKYTSPAVNSYLELFQINGKPISEYDFSFAVEKVKEAVQFVENTFKINPTRFEIETAIAFYIFYNKKCDYAVIETGFGGLLDATNIISKNILAIITSISFDHTEILGDTLDKIAYQKCGIIKSGCPVVTIEQNKEVMDIIKEVCLKKNSPLYIVKKENIHYNYFFGISQYFTYNNFENLKINLLGKFQTENASIAIEAVKVMMKNGIKVVNENIYNGLKLANWNSRFQIISKNPIFIIDGAHNEDASIRLRESIELYFKNKKIVFIIGVFKDKEYKKIIKNTADIADMIYTVTLKNSRSMDGNALAQFIYNYNENVVYKDNFYDAVLNAVYSAGKDGVVICFGSLSYLKDIAEIIKNKGGNL